MGNAEFATTQLLSVLRIRFNTRYVIGLLKEKEDFPSLASINATLKDMNLKTYPCKLESDEINDIRLPAIAQLVRPTNQFVVIESVSASKGIVNYFNTANSLTTENKNSFCEKWNGIVLEVEKTRFSGEKKYLLHKATHNKSLIGVFLGILLLIAGLLQAKVLPGQFFPVLLLVLHIPALMISWIIFLKDGLPGADILPKICSVNKIFDCQKVTQSGSGKLFNLATLAELSVLYYSFTTLLLFAGVVSTSLNVISKLLFYLQIAGLPVIVYSLYQQTFKIKAFCIFCLSISAIHITVTIILFVNYYSGNSSDFLQAFLSMEFLVSASLAVFIFVLGNELKVLHAKKSMEIVDSKELLLSMPGLFNFMISNGKQIPKDPFIINHITAGNKTAQHSIIIIVKPECIHCKGIVLQIEKLLHRISGIINIQLVLNSDHEISNHLISISLEQGAQASWDAYMVFVKEGVGKMYSKWPAKSEYDPQVENILRKYRIYCTRMEFATTPKIIVDGLLLHDHLNDLQKLSFYLGEYLKAKNLNAYEKV
jgi:uncharacterized membrane protein